MKITYLGDIMPLRIEHKQPFPVEHLAGLRDMLTRSDFVVGNLEAPIVHDATRSDLKIGRYRFAAPYEVAAQVRAAGVTHVSVCNNHSLDQGFAGLMETLDCVREAGLVPLGAARHCTEPTYAVMEKDGIRVAVFATTYGTNAYSNQVRLTGARARLFNLHQEQELNNYLLRWSFQHCPSLYKRLARFWADPDAQSSRDPHEIRHACSGKRRELAGKIRQMLQNENPDVFVAYPHEGGQHRLEPMLKARRLFKWLFSQGADAVICNHEHTVQRAELHDGRMAAFCLGNLVSYLGLFDRFDDNRENLSIMLHQYIERNCARKIELRYSFSVAKSFIGRDGKPETRPIHELITEAGTPEEREALVSELCIIGTRFMGLPWVPESPDAEEHPFPSETCQ